MSALFPRCAPHLGGLLSDRATLLIYHRYGQRAKTAVEKLQSERGRMAADLAQAEFKLKEANVNFHKQSAVACDFVGHSERLLVMYTQDTPALDWSVSERLLVILGGAWRRC